MERNVVIHGVSTVLGVLDHLGHTQSGRSVKSINGDLLLFACGRGITACGVVEAVGGKCTADRGRIIIVYLLSEGGHNGLHISACNIADVAVGKSLLCNSRLGKYTCVNDRAYSLVTSALDVLNGCRVISEELCKLVGVSCSPSGVNNETALNQSVFSVDSFPFLSKIKSNGCSRL